MNIVLVPAAKVPKIFSQRIKNRQDNEDVFITSMSAQFHDNPIIQNLMEYGLPNDSFLVDYLGHWHGPRQVMTIQNIHKKARNLFQKNFRGSYLVMGPPSFINFTKSTVFNRSHIKAYVVGKKILSLGGVNCVPYSYDDFIDIMLDFESDRFALYLDNFLSKSGNLRKAGIGERFWLNGQNEVLVDYGKRNQSIILTSLLKDLGKELSSVTLSSTYIPYGKLDNVLFRHSQKGRPITFYTNHPSKFRLPYSSTGEKQLQTFYALKAKTPWVDNRPDKFNHLKAAIIQYHGGDKVAYVGSHNFHQLPVWAGTAEMCLRTTDEKLIGELERFMKENLGS